MSHDVEVVDRLFEPPLSGGAQVQVEHLVVDQSSTVVHHHHHYPAARPSGAVTRAAAVPCHDHRGIDGRRPPLFGLFLMLASQGALGVSMAVSLVDPEVGFLVALGVLICCMLIIAAELISWVQRAPSTNRKAINHVR